MRWRFFSRVPGDDLPAALAPLKPWSPGRPSILAHLRAHPTDPAGAPDLPDEEPTTAGGIRWSAGAKDGVWAAHGSPKEQAAIAASIAAALHALAARPDIVRARALYGFLMEYGALTIVDALLPRLNDRWRLPPARLRDIALWILGGSPDREPVKYAIALLGLSGDDEDRELLTSLGRHEEFTLFAMVALQHSAADPEAALWDLSKLVTGWGRIHTVQRLAESTRTEIRRWLITEGCDNAIMPEYTAYACAVGGGLGEALQDPGAADDAPLLEGASLIIAALAQRGGPAETLDAVESPGSLVARYVDLIAGLSEPTVGHLGAVAAVGRFLDEPGADWTEGSLASWSAASRAALAARCREVLTGPAARRAVERGLAAPAGDDLTFNRAADLAGELGIDAWERRFERLRAGSDQWYWLMLSPDPARIERILDHARSALPLDSLAGPPTHEILPSGPGAEHHRALDWIVSYLRPFPGRGWDLVRLALSSPYLRLRNMAVATLGEWPRDGWPGDARAALTETAGHEVDDETRESIAKLLAAGP